MKAPQQIRVGKFVYRRADENYNKNKPKELSVQVEHKTTIIDLTPSHQFIKTVMVKLCKEMGGELVSSDAESFAAFPVNVGEVLIRPIQKKDDSVEFEVELHSLPKKKGEKGALRPLATVPVTSKTTFMELRRELKKQILRGRKVTR